MRNDFIERLDGIPSSVYENIEQYFYDYLPGFKRMLILKASNHPDDHYLYHVIARNTRNNTYTVWTCWNDSTKCLNHGHYGIDNLSWAIGICDDMFHDVKR